MYNPYQFMQPYQIPFQQQATMQAQPQYDAQFMEVDGRGSIDNLAMPPNQRRVYFDKNRDRFYSVQTDALGSKSVSEFDFTRVEESSPESYLTVSRFDEWRNDFEQRVLAWAAGISESGQQDAGKRKEAGPGIEAGSLASQLGKACKH